MHSGGQTSCFSLEITPLFEKKEKASTQGFVPFKMCVDTLGNEDGPLIDCVDWSRTGKVREKVGRNSWNVLFFIAVRDASFSPTVGENSR